MNMLPPGRKIDGLAPSVLPTRPIDTTPTKPWDFSGMDKMRKPGFRDLLKNPQVLQAFASMLSSSEPDEEANPYAGPRGSYGSGRFNYGA